MKIQKTYIPFLSLIFLFVSCSVQKRNYLSGYHVEWRKGKHSKVNSKHPDENVTLAKKRGHSAARVPEDQIVLNEKPISPALNGNVKITSDNLSDKRQGAFNTAQLNSKLEECDVLILKNGDELSVKIFEIGADEIKYKKCDNQSGPIYVVRKADAFMIKYANGTKEVIKQPNALERVTPAAKSQAAPNTYKKMEPLGVLALITSVGGLFLPLLPGLALEVVALIMGIISLVKISKAPDTLKGKGFGIAAIIISGLLLLIAFAVIAILI